MSMAKEENKSVEVSVDTFDPDNLGKDLGVDLTAAVVYNSLIETHDLGELTEKEKEWIRKFDKKLNRKSIV